MKLEQVQLRIEPELRLKLQALADEDQRSLASMVRKIVRAAIVPPSAGANAGGAR
jgi:predicted DNA-binding protein